MSMIRPQFLFRRSRALAVFVEDTWPQPYSPMYRRRKPLALRVIGYAFAIAVGVSGGFVAWLIEQALLR